MSGGGSGDLFAALPDELPSREAVQSSFLSRRWRHLWRSAPTVRVRGEGAGFRLFVNNLLLRRYATSPPLRSFDIEADLVTVTEYPYMKHPDVIDNWRAGKVDPYVELWVTHALSSCRARSLTARFVDEWVPWRPRSPLTFASPHLTTLHLDVVRLVDGLLDFSCCPALRSLALVRCRLKGDAVVSPSLERLALVDCYSEIGGDPMIVDDWLHVGISTPRLRCMEISKFYKRKQFLDMMPWLTEDSIRYTSIQRIYSGQQWAGADDV